jgi:hypothetical protein
MSRKFKSLSQLVPGQLVRVQHTKPLGRRNRRDDGMHGIKPGAVCRVVEVGRYDVIVEGPLMDSWWSVSSPGEHGEQYIGLADLRTAKQANAKEHRNV